MLQKHVTKQLSYAPPVHFVTHFRQFACIASCCASMFCLLQHLACIVEDCISSKIITLTGHAACSAGVADAEAFLHERLGDLEAALRLHMAAVEKTNSQLVTALASGRIPVLQLPGGLGMCGAAAAGVSRQGSGLNKVLQQVGVAAGDHNSSSSSNRVQGEQIQWGLGALLQQLQAQHALQVSGTATPEVTQSAAATAASVAASLLQQLAPAASSHSHQHQHQYQQHQLPAQQQQQQQQHPYLLSHHGGAGAGSSAAATLQSACCVCVDLHKAWMAELSPRLKLKGLGYSAVYSPAQSGSGGIASASNAAAAAALAEVPQELHAAWQALQAALAFCKRNTTSSSGSSCSATGCSQRHSSSSSNKQREADEAGGGKQLWFGLMDVYVARMRSVPSNTAVSPAAAAPSHTRQQQQQHSQHQLAVTPQLLESLAAAAAGQLGPDALPKVLLAAAAALASCVAHDLFSLLLDEVVCVMADHLPLLDIVGRVLQQHGSERFGEFRSTLLGLFGATAYESAIMQAANRWGLVGGCPTWHTCWLVAASVLY
jgi:hypothetical protein